MTGQTFTNDQGNTGTTNDSFTTPADHSTGGEPELGNKLQQQIDVMQKRMGDKDDFIGTLQGENQTLRERMADIESKLESMGSVEDALARMDEAKNSNQDTTLDEDTLVSNVLNKLSAKSEKEQADNNFNAVSATLTKTYGADKVDDIVSAAAIENGLSFDDMFELARKSPQAVYRMVGVKQSTGTTNPSRSTNIGTTSDVETKEQKLAYFSKMRRENPADYYKPENQKAFREICLSK